MLSANEQTSMHLNPARLIVGYAAIAVVVILWSSFALSVRAIHGAGLSEADLALIRYGIPTVALLPLIGREWPHLRRLRASDALMVAAGGGLPFFFIVSFGGSLTSAAVVGSLVTGTLPLTVTLLGWALEGQVPGRDRIVPIVVIIAGVFALIIPQAMAQPGTTLSAGACLLVGSCLWAIYTIGIRRSKLSSAGCAILLCAPSTVGLLIALPLGWLDISFDRLSTAQALPFILVQGLGAGLLSGLAYPFAIARIGGPKAALFGSLTPAVTCVAALGLLGEVPTDLALCGVLTITVGVALANRSKPRPRTITSL